MIAHARRGSSMWRRELAVWRHFYRTSLLLNFGQPLMWLLTFGFALGAYVSLGRPGGYLVFVAPGLLAVTGMNVVTFDSMFGTWVKLHEWGTYEAVVSTPVSPREILLGVLFWESTRSVMFGGCFGLVMLAFGLIRSPWALLLPLLLAAIGPLFAPPAIAWATRSEKFHSLFYYTELVVAPMFFFSGAFFPVDRLPGYLQAMIWVMPLSHLVSLTRAVVSGVFQPSLLLDVAYLLVVMTILIPLSMRIFARHLTD